MNHSTGIKHVSMETARCPYCSEKTSVDLPGDFEPVYAYCSDCGKKFIVERLVEGFQVLKREGAPCSSDPDCREIEIGGGDEE